MTAQIQVDLPNVFNIDDETIEPSVLDVLEQYASEVAQRSHSFLEARVLRSESSVEQVLLSFEIKVPTRDFSSVLFQVRHRAGSDYPAVIIPPEPLPGYLQKKRTRVEVRPESLGATVQREGKDLGRWDVNPWVAYSYVEFLKIVKDVFELPEVISMIANLRRGAKAVLVK